VSALAILTRYWREMIIGIAVLVIVGYCRARDHAIADRARAEVLYHRADSTVQANAPKLAHVDTLLVRDTVWVAKTAKAAAAIHDTVVNHLTDTGLVKEYIARTDTALNACTELSRDCQQFRAFAFERFAQDSIKLATQPRITAPPIPRVGVKTGIVVGVLTTIGGLWLVHSLSPHP